MYSKQRPALARAGLQLIARVLHCSFVCFHLLQVIRQRQPSVLYSRLCNAFSPPAACARLPRAPSTHHGNDTYACCVAHALALPLLQSHARAQQQPPPMHARTLLSCRACNQRWMTAAAPMSLPAPPAAAGCMPACVPPPWDARGGVAECSCLSARCAACWRTSGDRACERGAPHTAQRSHCATTLPAPKTTGRPAGDELATKMH